MGAPLICSIFLLRDKQNLNFHGNNVAANDYLFHSQNEDDEQNLNLGTYSLQCGRRADCVKLWLMWNHYGKKGLETRVDHLIDLARYAEHKVKSSDKLSLALQSAYVNVCFYYDVDDTSINHDVFHEKIKTYPNLAIPPKTTSHHLTLPGTPESPPLSLFQNG